MTTFLLTFLQHRLISVIVSQLRKLGYQHLALCQRCWPKLRAFAPALSVSAGREDGYLSARKSDSKAMWLEVRMQGHHLAPKPKGTWPSQPNSDQAERLTHFLLDSDPPTATKGRTGTLSGSRCGCQTTPVLSFLSSSTTGPQGQWRVMFNKEKNALCARNGGCIRAAVLQGPRPCTTPRPT